jgi:hypothetical protein
MAILSELISLHITPEKKTPKNWSIEELSGLTAVRGVKEHCVYEAEVFNYLVTNKVSLGIKTVMRFSCLLVEGAVDLTDGRRLTIEVKYRMNWGKACQAECQFRNFLKRHTEDAGPVQGGLVFFEEFSGDWDHQTASRNKPNGWDNWYIGHSQVENLRVDLLRFCGGTLESYPMAVK